MFITQLVFSAFGGMGGAATIAYRRLASLMVTHRDQPFSTVTGVQSVFRC